MDYGVSFVAHVLAWDTSANTYKTGDSANIVLKWNKDGTSATTTNACSEVDATNEPGVYKVTITAAEAQCTLGKLSGKSSTANIVVIGYEYEFIKFGAPAGASISADVAAVKSDTATTLAAVDTEVGTLLSRLGSPVGASLSADIASVKTDTGTTIPGRLPAALGANGNMKADVRDFNGAAGTFAAGRPEVNTSHVGGTLQTAADIGSLVAKFAGITLFRHWLGAIAGKQAADATALTELRASGAGSGTFDPTTDSVEALRDRGDAAWVTGTTPPTVVQIRQEMDTNSTQLAAAITALGLIDDFVDDLETRLSALRAGYLDNLSAGAVAQAATALSNVTWTNGRAALLDQILADFGSAYQNVSFAQAQKLMLAVLVGPTSGLAGATAHMKKLDGSADAVVAAIDPDGIRGVPTLTP